jgi:hypothetical protein
MNEIGIRNGIGFNERKKRVQFLIYPIESKNID